jgi:hypothetical protein
MLVGDALGRGMVRLLNAAPDRSGRIGESSVKTLAEAGKLRKRRVPPDLPK